MLKNFILAMVEIFKNLKEHGHQGQNNKDRKASNNDYNSNDDA